MGRTKTIKIRVSSAEEASIKELGKRSGGISALVRQRLLEGRSGEDKAETLRGLARLSSNLNLIARQAKRFPPVAAVEMIGRLIAIERLVAEPLRQLCTKRPKC